QPPAPPSPPRGPAQPVAQPPTPPSPPRGPAQPVAPNGSGEPGRLLGPETRAGAGASVPGPAIGSGEPVAPPSPPLFPDVPADAPPARTRTGPHPATAGAAPPAGIFPDAVLPTREELTKAWGDGVLRGLSGKAKAYLQSGRFVSVGAEGAVFALPNQQWLTRSLDARGEAEAALAARFGRPVPLKLIVEPVAAASAEGAPEPADEAEYVDLDHLTDAEVAVISPEQRLMDAFPGAEEVST
ncbi:MAG: polymerase subunit gamma/tau, partial [Acidimicrobiaceae bacterium]|nr:polymerase subunit gamma/tau [Acidimicrobiaceae bacterium]